VTTAAESDKRVIETSPSEQLFEKSQLDEVPKDGEADQEVIETTPAKTLPEETKPEEQTNQAFIETSHLIILHKKIPYSYKYLTIYLFIF